MNKKLLIGLGGVVLLVLAGVMVFGNVPSDSSAGRLKGVIKEATPVRGEMQGKNKTIKEAPKQTTTKSVNSAKTRDDLMPPGQDSQGAGSGDFCNGEDCGYYRTFTCTMDKAGNPAVPLTQEEEVTYSNLCEDEYDECKAPCMPTS